jgi:hypothetical protein
LKVLKVHMVLNTPGGHCELTKLDHDALNYASCRNLPSQFACHSRSPEAIIASIKKEDIKERLCELGIKPTGSLAQMIKTIAEYIVERAQPAPLQYVSLNNIIASTGALETQQAPELFQCWLCGCRAKSISLENIADLQIGSWPPGDPRRWQLGRSFVISVAVCQGYSQLPAQRPNRICLDNDVLELQARLYRKSSNRLPCKVGEFPTISGIFWEGRWQTIDEAMTLCTGDRLADAVISCPEEPSIERVCLQVLNWFSMSGLDKTDKNCLPARVYLSRPARLVCRAGQVVGYMTYTAVPNEHFPVPTVCAIYVRPEARGKGACKALMHNFVIASREANKSKDGVLLAVVGADGAEDVTDDDCEIYGIEAPVSKGSCAGGCGSFCACILKVFWGGVLPVFVYPIAPSFVLYPFLPRHQP